MEKNNYYVYLHIKEDTGEPFYVGKGKDKRYNVKSGRSKYWKNIVDKHGFDIIFLEIDLTNEEAIKKEIYWIDRIGRKDLGNGTLVNFTDGGEGTINRPMTEKNKKIISECNKKMKHRLGSHLTDEHKKMISDRHKGKIDSKDTKIKKSLSRKNKKYYNNGIICKMFYEGTQPENFILGKYFSE